MCPRRGRLSVANTTPAVSALKADQDLYRWASTGENAMFATKLRSSSYAGIASARQQAIREKIGTKYHD